MLIWLGQQVRMAPSQSNCYLVWSGFNSSLEASAFWSRRAYSHDNHN